MKIMTCPLNGPRNISEFVRGAEYAPLPAFDAPPEAWAEHVFFPANKAGIVIEWWCHVPTSYWFLAERDTRSDRILRTFPASAAP
jgi:sarcosine oxidase subunit delta